MWNESEGFVIVTEKRRLGPRDVKPEEVSQSTHCVIASACRELRARKGLKANSATSMTNKWRAIVKSASKYLSCSFDSRPGVREFHSELGTLWNSARLEIRHEITFGCVALSSPE
jgi:hypothetical protein